MLTDLGYNELIKLDSLRTIRVFLKLVQMRDIDNSIKITQKELSAKLNLKNKANVNSSIAELLAKDFIKKTKDKDNKTVYYINPNLCVTQKCYTELQKKYNAINFDIAKALENLNF